MLLPPKVSGPISELSTQITVLGAVSGASVQLLANGAPLASPVVAAGLSIVVPVTGAGLAAGQHITARQSLGTDLSAASPFAEIVSAAPPSSVGLPAVVFLSNPHPCVDWVLIGGMVPGATAVITLAGSTIGKATSEGPVVPVPVTMPSTSAAGQLLEAFQTLTGASGTMTGPKVRSMPLQARPAGEPPAPQVTPPFQCDLAVLVSGLQDGASLVVKHETRELAGYPYVGTPVWASLAEPVRIPQQISARQRTLSCRADSGFSAPVGVNPAPRLPKPVIVGPICPNAPMLLVRNLRPGAMVTVFVKRDQGGGSSSSSQIGQATAWATECEFPMPPQWADPQNVPPGTGKLFIDLFQENCDRGSETASHVVEPLPGAVGQPVAEEPVECARLIHATGMTPGAFALVTSDQADWPQLSSAVKVLAGEMAFGLNRPLRKGEHVQVVQSGCNAGATSAAVEAAAFAGIGAPVVEGPVRIPLGQMGIRKLVVGARLHVLVNGVVRVAVDVDATRMVVPLVLNREDMVSARQTMCARISDESNREPAKLGDMKTAHTPSPLTRGKAESVTVTATDIDDGQPVNGSVRMGGTIVAATGAAFGVTFPVSGGAPASAVEAAGYNPGAITWNLVNPPPTPPAMLHLSVVNQATSYFKITAVNWTVVLQDASGLTVVAAPVGESVTVTPPKTGQYLIRADVAVDDFAAGANVMAEFRGNATINGQSWLVLVWSNSAQSRTMRLTTETQQIWGGGGVYTVVNPVVVQ